MALERRLLVIAETLGVGGTESHLLRVLPRLVALGWKTVVFCLSERGELADELEARGMEVISTTSAARQNSGRRNPLSVTLAANKLFWFMRQWQPQIAHFYLPAPYVIGAPIAIARGIPVKIMSRRSLYDYQRNWPAVARFERVLHKRMDALVGNSRAVVAQLNSENVPKGKVRLIYNGVEVSEPLPPRSEARRALGLDENALVGVIVANLIQYKGHQDLITGLGQVARQLPSPWEILVAGRDHGLRAELESLAEKEQIAGHVKFLGQRYDVPRLLAAADFGLLTSHEEGFSNVVLESMAAALPMIVTDVGGNPEAVVNEQTGLVVPAHNPGAIGEAVLRLARAPELRKRFGAAGRDRVKQEFSIDRCVAAHADLYEELLAKVGAKRTYVRARSPAVGAAAYVRRSTRPLMLAYWGRHGALPQLTLELADACRRTGHGPDTTISISTSNELFDKYGKFGEAIFPVATYASALSAANIAAVCRLRRCLKERLLADGTRAFVTLMPHVWSPLITPMLREAGIRHTVIVHDADPHQGDQTAVINKWLLREAGNADQVVTLTTAVAERLVRLNIVPKKEISVLFHPDLTFPIEGRSSSESLRVLFFGRILPYKGLSQFVGAMEILKAAGLSIHVGVFGAGHIGPEIERLKRLGAEVVNRWIDPAHIADIFGRHDVVVVSHAEASQSGVIAAAHGAGLPVVATPVGGLSEQIIPEVTGVLATDTTAEAIAAAVRRFAEDRTLLLRIRQGIIATRRERSVDRFFCALRDVALKGV